MRKLSLFTRFALAAGLSVGGVMGAIVVSATAANADGGDPGIVCAESGGNPYNAATNDGDPVDTVELLLNTGLPGADVGGCTNEPDNLAEVNVLAESGTCEEPSAADPGSIILSNGDIVPGVYGADIYGSGIGGTSPQGEAEMWVYTSPGNCVEYGIASANAS